MKELLESGATSALSREPPATARGTMTDIQTLPDIPIEIFPEAEDVLDSFIGAGPNAGVPDKITLPKTEVTVVHSDLRFSRHPVLVGHYLGDAISGAETLLDHCLSNHLSDVRHMGLYPGVIETCEVMLRRDRNPPGGVVAGLGEFGDLTPGRLRRTIHRAVLRYALDRKRRATEVGQDLNTMEPIALTSLVNGHKGANMTVQQSVQAILEAIADANRTLTETPIAKLEFIELYEDTAFKTVSALHRASLNGRVAGAFHFDQKITSGHGARLRMDFGMESDTCQKITVTREREHLRYTVISEGAKAEFRKTAVQFDVIERLLEQSRVGTATRRNLGKLLFELMIPMELKSFAQSDQKIHLVLDYSTAHIPWEHMEDDASAFSLQTNGLALEDQFKPLVARTPVIRQLSLIGAAVSRAKTATALVVGDPVTSMNPLEGARKEAALVAGLLDKQAGLDVHYMDQPKDGISVLEAVGLKPAKIMHFAAHGIYDDTARHPTAGLVLSDGVFLTAAELLQMRHVPELVFLNCCHLGRDEANAGPIAASLSEALVSKGVRAVIAAGWAVDDAAALLFAEEVYCSMLNKNSFGDAVHHARQVVLGCFPNKNTWGAYQYYGDPNYRLHEVHDDYAPSTKQMQHFSADHARKAAVNIARDIDSTDKARSALLAQLKRIVDCADTGWDKDAPWCEAMGRAYARLDEYEMAVNFLQKARQASPSLVSINAIELLEDLKVRSAAFDWTRKEQSARSASP